MAQDMIHIAGSPNILLNIHPFTGGELDAETKKANQ